MYSGENFEQGDYTYRKLIFYLDLCASPLQPPELVLEFCVVLFFCSASVAIFRVKSNTLINALTYNFLMPSDFPKDANNIVIPRTNKKGGNKI